MGLKKVRTSKRIPLTFVAKKLGISRDRLMRIEYGESDLPTKCISVLVNLYDSSESEIIKLHMEDLNGESR